MWDASNKYFWKHLWKKLYRLEAYRKQKGFCYYCNKEVEQKKATADHLIPLQLGGSTERDNIVMACNSCNQLKANLAPNIYQAVKHNKKLVLSVRNTIDKLNQVVKL